MKYKTLLLLALFVSCTNPTDNKKDTTINVTGFSKLLIQPDMANINLTVSYDSPVRDCTIINVNKDISHLVDKIKTSGVRTQSLYTGNYTMYFRKDKKTKTLNYYGSQSIEFNVKLVMRDIEKLVGIIKNYPKVEIDISFDLSQKIRDSVAWVLTSKALRNADQKSKFIAERSSLLIEKIASISHNAGGYDWGGGAGAEYEQFDAEGNAVVFNWTPRAIELTENVNVSYIAKKNK